MAVTETPLVALILLSAGVGGRGAGELGRVTHTDRSVSEVGGRHGVDDHFSCCAVGLATYSDGAGVGAGHGHGAVRSGGVLLVRRVTIGACPAIRSTILSVDAQMNGFANTIGAVVGDNTRKNTAVGLARTTVLCLGERNCTRLMRIICNHQDVILSSHWRVFRNCAMARTAMVMLSTRIT